jgi:co-chaperonin GroES (HSP10)|tara:strand:+ start:7772 stop:8248 length:477 start_codon:yes stop_codon:yes gene_type:complete
MEAKNLTSLEKKWKEDSDSLDKGSLKPSLNDAYTEDGKVAHEGLAESVLDLIPRPTGWRLAILPYRGVQTTKGGILLSDETHKKTQLGTNVGYVLKTGDLAYADESKFPLGPWCKEGDWVIFGRYAGSRIQIDGGEIRLLNDDEVLGLVNDPDDILHM